MTDTFADKVRERQKRESVDFQVRQRAENIQRGLAGQPPQQTTAERVRAKLRGEKIQQSTAGLGPEVLQAGPEGLDASTRARLSFFADTPQERQGVFLEKFPQGTMTTDPVTGEEIFRRQPDQPFQKVDPGIAESFAGGFKSGITEIGRDIADIAGDVPSLAAESAALLATRGAGITGRAVSTGVGGGLGEGARQGAQTFAGTQQESFSDQADRIVGATATGALGSGAGDVVAGLTNAVRRSGALSVPEEAQEAILAAQRLDVPALLPNQATDNPIVRRLGGQAAALLPSVNRYVANQERRLRQALAGASNPSARAALINRGVAEHEQASRDIVQAAIRRPVTARSGGRAIQQGISVWEEASRREVSSLYEAARSIEEPLFDLSALKQVAEGIKAGTPGRTESGGTVRLSAIEPELERVADDILALDPSLPPVDVPGGQVTGTDQLRELAKRLHDMTLAGPEGKREPQFIAGRLFGAIKDTLNNPVGGSPEFVNAWQAANKAAARRFGTREKLAIVNAARSETPSQLAARLAHPGQVDNLAVLRKVVPEEKWVKFRESFKTTLLDGDLTENIGRFDEPTLNTLLSKPEQDLFRDTGRKLDRLKAINFDAAAEADQTAASFVDDIIGTNSIPKAAALSDLVKSSGGRDSPMGRSVRSGILDSVLRDVSRLGDEGRQAVSANALQAAVDNLRATGLDRLLKPQEMQLLNDARLVQSFLRRGADAGTSLQAASAVAGLRDLSGKALDTLLENFSIGRVLTSNFGRQLLTGVGQKPKERLVLRLLALTATDLANSAEQELGTKIRQAPSDALSLTTNN